MSNTKSHITDTDHPVPPVHRDRAADYPMLENGATMGTICRYEPDGWTWVIITDLQDKPGREYGGLNFDTDEPLVRFLNLDKLPDAAFARFEGKVGCYQHVAQAREFRDFDGAGLFTPRSTFCRKFEPLGPLHPDARDGDDDE